MIKIAVIYTFTLFCFALDMIPNIFFSDDPFLSFVGWGDWGTTKTSQRDVASMMDNYADSIKSSFTILIGDNFYDHGVKLDDDPLFESVFENTFIPTKHLKNHPFYAIMGNHDWRGNITSQTKYKSPNGLKWEMPNFWYSNVYQFKEKNSIYSTLFIYIDTFIWVDTAYDHPQAHEHIAKQLSWINETLAAGAHFADFIFVIGHHPVFSVGSHGTQPRLVSDLRPLLTKYGVDGYICGHDHSLQALYEIKDEKGFKDDQQWVLMRSGVATTYRDYLRNSYAPNKYNEAEISLMDTELPTTSRPNLLTSLNIHKLIDTEKSGQDLYDQTWKELYLNPLNSLKNNIGQVNIQKIDTDMKVNSFDNENNKSTMHDNDVPKTQDQLRTVPTSVSLLMNINPSEHPFQSFTTTTTTFSFRKPKRTSNADSDQDLSSIHARESPMQSYFNIPSYKSSLRVHLPDNMLMTVSPDITPSRLPPPYAPYSSLVDYFGHVCKDPRQKKPKSNSNHNARDSFETDPLADVRFVPVNPYVCMPDVDAYRASPGWGLPQEKEEGRRSNWWPFIADETLFMSSESSSEVMDSFEGDLLNGKHELAVRASPYIPEYATLEHAWAFHDMSDSSKRFSIISKQFGLQTGRSAENEKLQSRGMQWGVYESEAENDAEDDATTSSDSIQNLPTFYLDGRRKTDKKNTHYYLQWVNDEAHDGEFDAVSLPVADLNAYTLYILSGAGGKRDRVLFKPSKDLLYGAQVYGFTGFKVTATGFQVQFVGKRSQILATINKPRHPYRACIKQLGYLPDDLNKCPPAPGRFNYNRLHKNWSQEEIMRILPSIVSAGIDWKMNSAKRTATRIGELLIEASHIVRATREKEPLKFWAIVSSISFVFVFGLGAVFFMYYWAISNGPTPSSNVDVTTLS